jgi:3',5'-cyclic AMP phosphodiesterase CpdA
VLTRRQLLKGAGASGLALAAGPTLWRVPAIAGAPPPEQLHLAFGADAATAMTASWVTPTSVARPRLRLGTAAGGAGTSVPAHTRTYTDAKTGAEVFTHHVELTGLDPARAYTYEVLHDGADPVGGAFSTAPQGRQPFRFSSFGDQGTGRNEDRVSTIYGAFVVDQIEQAKPLFHLLNGDLAYANQATDRVAQWAHFMNNNMPSARNRPWMPALGNHENESGNGPQGFDSYLTRYLLPDNGVSGFRGNWYAFTVGNVRFVSLDNDDVCYQDGGDFYVRKYSGGVQKAWIARTLSAARADPGIDFIVVFMHQLAMSSAIVNGSDLGVREEWLPLFDRYGVDLVLCGHDHDYERTHPVRGMESAANSNRPMVADHNTSVIDTTKGTVHMCVGTGGSVPLNATYASGVTGTPVGQVITGRNSTDHVPEICTWSAVRDHEYAFGFLVIDVDPGVAGGKTRMKANYYRTAPQMSGGSPILYDSFELVRPRRDAVVAPPATGGVVLPNTSAGVPTAPILTGALGAAAGLREVVTAAINHDKEA